MSSTAKTGIRMKREEIHVSEFSLDVSSTTDTSYDFTFDLPPGGYHILANVWATDLAQDATIKIYPYADKEQTLVDGANVFLQAGVTTVTTNIVVTASTTTAHGYTRAVIQSGDQYGLAAPLLSLYGAKMTIATTAVTGILHISSMAMET